MRMGFLNEKTQLKYLPFLSMLVITAQLASNILGARTIILMDSFLLPGGILSFPLTFFLWDIISEVYGFKRARQLIFFYMVTQIFFAFLINFGLRTQVAPSILNPEYYNNILADVFRITISMVFAIVCGDFVNCYALDRLKRYTQGRYLWMRLIAATALGELITSLVWVFSFYFGKQHHPNLFNLISSQYVIKILFEIAFIPPTYIIVRFLKNNEHIDFSKKYINFNPITLEKFASDEK